LCRDLVDAETCAGSEGQRVARLYGPNLGNASRLLRRLLRIMMNPCSFHVSSRRL
jgi:hypothetical protein